MKNTSLIFLKSLGLFLLLFVVVLSCKKEEDPVPEKQKANFEFENATVDENIGGAAQVKIVLAKATTEAGTLTVSITNGTGVAYTTNYVTNPNGADGSFEVAVAKGATTASFTITPVDDTEENDARVITFKLTAATGGVELGDKTSLELRIIDNDTPAAVNFVSASGTVAENATGALTVNLDLTSAAVNAGTFDVSYTSDDAVYTTDFTTNPDGASGTFTVNVAADAATASFTVMPVDNAVDEADKTVTFTISNATGGVNIGQVTTFALTIENDDDAITKTIAEIRALYDGSANIDITENWVIKGTVTSKNDAVNERNLFIQDGTGGIAIRWDEAHAFAQGDSLTVAINGATISDFNDLVQIGGTMPLANGTKTGSGSITPEVITLAQLNSGDFQGKLITVENVTFSAADGIVTFSGNNDISDGGTTALVRVESGAGFSSEVLPLGTGNVTGIAGVYQGTAQALPQERADVFANDPASDITVTQNITDFGNVDSNTSSASQSYTVSGTSLTEDIVVTAPNQFEVSLDDISFSGSVSVLAADAMAGDVTVYARFSPNTGFSGTPTGDIAHTSAGAVTQLVPVSGTEVPPGGGSSLLMADDFDYGGVAGDLTTITTNWVKSSGTAPLAYLTTSLSMTSYPSSGVGGSVGIADPNTSAEDASRIYAKQSTGTVYVSALVNIASFDANGDDYFYHLRSESGSFFARVYAKDDGAGNLNFGIRENSTGGTAPQYATGSYTYATTYLLVIKYEFATGTASLFVLDNAAATEPGSADAVSSDGVDPSDLAQVGIRQGNNTPNAVIDGIRVATDWAGIMN